MEAFKRSVLQSAEDQSAANVKEVAHGEWIKFNSQAAGEIQYCSVCGIGNESLSDYCPHCGAKMDGRTESEE